MKQKCLKCGRFRKEGHQCPERKVRPVRLCEICGKSYEKPVGLGGKNWGKRKYCSHKCYSKMVKVRMLGENHPNWKGGIAKNRSKRYVGGEYRECRKKVFERDDYTCRICGANSGSYLETHHIIPVREAPEKEFDMNNILTFCLPCHIVIDRYRAQFFLRR